MKYLDVHRNGMTGLSFKIHFDPFTWASVCYPLESLWIPEATKTAMQKCLPLDLANTLRYFSRYSPQELLNQWDITTTLYSLKYLQLL